MADAATLKAIMVRIAALFAAIASIFEYEAILFVAARKNYLLLLLLLFHVIYDYWWKISLIRRMSERDGPKHSVSNGWNDILLF